MNYGICILSIVPVRRDPSDKSEMVTQLLFGELVLIQQSTSSWLQIRIVADQYEGWVDERQILLLSSTEYSRLSKLPESYTTELIDLIHEETTHTVFPVVFGSTMRGLYEGSFTLGHLQYHFEGNVIPAHEEIGYEALIENALLFYNAPYLWGGKSPFGIDCSGFVQVVYKLAGVQLLRDAYQQATLGEQISLLEEALPGDLLFFDNEEGRIVHVGILMDDRKILHASGQVRKDLVDHQGIYNLEKKQYTHQLRLIRRVL